VPAQGTLGRFLLQRNINGVSGCHLFAIPGRSARVPDSLPANAKVGRKVIEPQRVMSRAIFPAPDHDHGRCASAAIAHAEAQCAARAQRLTPMRRRVLETLLASHQPLGAYEIMSRLPQRNRPAPITIYRALDFLVENGLVHRIETRNAFVACVHNHGGDDLVIFLICERYGAVGEAPGGGAAEALKASSRAAGFSPKSPVIEIAGICSHCRDR
jgi:Fur family transcriptional regulator, zinc uptake regulator